MYEWSQHVFNVLAIWEQCNERDISISVNTAPDSQIPKLQQGLLA